MNMSLKKVEMPLLDSKYRIKNFLEVATGYTEEMAVEEANRCLNCKDKPCTQGCPVNVRIPEFIQKIKEKDFAGAYKIISSTNSLPAICGRVCPQEVQCEGKCVRGLKGEPVAIGRLERFVSDWDLRNSKKVIAENFSKNKKVAIIGSGPAGLSCAGDLAKLGYEVTVFEGLHRLGGVLRYGIPEFRLPKSIVSAEVHKLQRIGVSMRTNMLIGRTLSVLDLKSMGFEAIFIGTGAGSPGFMGLDGESNLGVYSANEFLTRINLMKAYDDKYDTPINKAKNIAVIGGGNVAMDAARCAKRLGAENVYVIYRRSQEEMPARLEEITHAKEEGIEFLLLTNPTKIVGDENGNTVAIECEKMELGEPDSSGRRAPVAIENSAFSIAVESVIEAIGNRPNPLIRMVTDGLEANEHQGLLINDDLQTTVEGIYAGGDAVTGAATVILAMGAGKCAANSIDKYLSSKK